MTGKLFCKALAFFAVGAGLVGALIFLPAGTLNFFGGWLLMGVLFVPMLVMGVVMMVLWYPKRKQTSAFRWSWAIPFISLFLCVADFAYFTSLAQEGALISVVSMVRRGSVVVSFLCGALLFHEKNLRSKALDLLLVLLGMVCLYIGSI